MVFWDEAEVSIAEFSYEDLSTLHYNPFDDGF